MRKALLVGINDYPRAPLRGCEKDAERISEVLSTNYDGSKNFDCQVLASVTRRVLKRRIEELFSGQSDIALLYFSGYSVANEFGEYLATTDSDKHDFGVSFDEIISLVNESRSRNIVIILDCSYSGAFGSFISANKRYTKLREGVSILGASLASQEARENIGGGLFTGLLYDALSGKAASMEGRVDLLSVFAYTNRFLNPWKQSPVLKTHLTNPVILRRVEPLKLGQKAAVSSAIANSLQDLISSKNQASLEKVDLDSLKDKIEELINEAVDQSEKKKVFISYAHADQKWLSRIQIHLKPIIREGLIEIWDDTKIRSGENWRSEIDQALTNSKIAILLISADFLASDFIAENELPPLLKNAEDKGASILPLILGHCRFMEDERLSQFQAVNDPKKPIESLSKSEQDKIFYKLSLEIERILAG